MPKSSSPAKLRRRRSPTRRRRASSKKSPSSPKSAIREWLAKLEKEYRVRDREPVAPRGKPPPKRSPRTGKWMR